VREAAGWWRLALSYFLFFFTQGLFLPYFPAFLHSNGLDGVRIGTLLAVGPLMRVLVPPVVGLLSDRYRGPHFWGKAAGWGAVAGLCLTAADERALVAGVVVYFIFSAPAISLLDASALQHLKGNVRASFGRIRLWGSVGFALASFGLGLLYPDLPPHVVLFGLFGSYVLFAGFLSGVRGEAESPGGLSWEGLPQLLKGGVLWLLLVTVFLNRIASAPFNVFYTLFVGELGHGGELVAWSWGIGVAAEVLAMLVVDRFIDRLGVDRVLAGGVLLEALRWLAYVWVQSEAALLLLTPLHGTAFAFLYVASVRAAAAVVPERLRALGQGLIAAAAGCGQTVGFVGAGYLHETVGSRGMFFFGGAVGMSAFAIALLFGRLINRRRG
jgi:MFS transporter, PPP family, 3-phenylpropionic acid transporter